MSHLTNFLSFCSHWWKLQRDTAWVHSKLHLPSMNSRSWVMRHKYSWYLAKNSSKCPMHPLHSTSCLQMRNIRLSACFLCKSQFQSGMTRNEEALEESLLWDGGQKCARNPTGMKKKRAQLVCGSSMTSGNTELHLGWAILETVFLNLN